MQDIVPDPSNLLTKTATIPEHLELGEDGGDEELQNGHKNGDNHEDDDEIGPSLPKQKRIQVRIGGRSTFFSHKISKTIIRQIQSLLNWSIYNSGVTPKVQVFG